MIREKHSMKLRMALLQFDRREIALTDEGYAPLTGNVEERRTIPVSADSPEEAYIYYGIPLDGLSDHEMDVLSPYCACTSQAAPRSAICSCVSCPSPCSIAS